MDDVSHFSLEHLRRARNTSSPKLGTMIDNAAISQVLDLFLPRIQHHRVRGQRRPFILAISGLQGSGKSTWAKALADTLNVAHNINTRTVSLDDFYHDHQTLAAIRDSNADNLLLRTRGQPGTHDEVLANEFFASLDEGISQEPIRLPAYDKSQFDGEGDRVPKDQWAVIPRQWRIEVLIFEGWCLGFQPLSDEELEAKVAAATEAAKSPTTRAGLDTTTVALATHRIAHLRLINDHLRRYCSSFMGPSHFDGLLQLSTDNLHNVYQWRLDQEHALRAAVGLGMTDEEVVRFVRGYMPAYEMYLDRLTEESFFQSTKMHVRVMLNSERRPIKVSRC